MFDLANMLDLKIFSQPWKGAEGVPYYLNEIYSFREVIMDGTPCIFAEPRSETPTIQAMAKHFSAIYSAASLPVVLKMNGLSGERQKALIAVRIPFVAPGQVYLPFLGVILQKRLYSDPKSKEKLMPSAQLLLFAYLYQSSKKMYTSPMSVKFSISSMQITRAARQLQNLNLFEISKEGVQVVIIGKTNHRALFEGAAQYLIDPVREVCYVPRDEQKNNLPYAGINALSELTMLAAPDVPTYAYYSKKEKINGEYSLIDHDKQARVEIWKYDPIVLSEKSNIADPLSVIVSLKDERDDDRIEQAIEDILKNMWR